MIVQNRSLMKKYYPVLYSFIDRIDPNENVQVTFNREGNFIFQIPTIDGKTVLTNSRYHLQRDVEKNIKGINYHATLIIWTGMASGYEIMEVLKNKDDMTRLVVVEPNLDVVKAVMQYVDLSFLLMRDDITLVAGNAQQIQSQLRAMNLDHIVLASAGIWKHFHPYCMRVYHATEVESIFRVIEQELAFRLNMKGNDPEDTLLGINHFFSNIKYITKSFPLNMIKGNYQGYPAICVSAGPSLDKNIDELKKLQDKALIFCVDAVWERIIYEGIIPDAVFTMERDKGTYNLFFRDKQDQLPEQTCLVAKAVAYPKLFMDSGTETIIFAEENIPFERLASQFLTGLNRLHLGVSCSHTAFSLARYLGCDPVIVVGQDLAYGEHGFSHAKGTYGEKKTKADQIFRDARHLYVPNLTRTGMVETNDTYQLFRQWFETQIAGDSSRCYINATEGGSYIEGMLVMTLTEVGQQYLQHGHEKIRLIDKIKQVKSDFKISYEELEAHFQKQLYRLCKLSDRFKKLSIDFSQYNRQYLKHAHRESSNEGLSVSLLVFKKLIDRLNDIWGNRDDFFYIVQHWMIELRQFTDRHRNIVTLHDLNIVFTFIVQSVKKIMEMLEKTIYEYERGLLIIQNKGECDCIDTPLMGEMYEP